MSETVDSVAQEFLKHLSAKGMKSVPVQHTSFYRETEAEAVQRMDREFKKNTQTPSHRFEIMDENVSERFILKHGKKYFYGFKGSETKWTYEPRLAQAVSEVEADALKDWMEVFGTPVVCHLVSKGKQ
jgi:hypothetical protein